MVVRPRVRTSSRKRARLTLPEHAVERFGTAYRKRNLPIQVVPARSDAPSPDAHRRQRRDALLRTGVRTQVAEGGFAVWGIAACSGYSGTLRLHGERGTYDVARCVR